MVKKYAPYMQDFVNQMQFNPCEDLRNMGLAKDITQKYHNIYDLPTNLEFETLDLSELDGVVIPEGLNLKELSLYDAKNITLPRDLQIDGDDKILMSEETTLNFIPPSIRDEQIEGMSSEKIAKYRQKFAEAYPNHQATVKKIDQLKSKLIPQNKGTKDNLIKGKKAGMLKYIPQPKIHQY